MRLSRDNTHKKNIINNIFNKIGLSSNYSSRIIDDLIFILISSIVIKKKIKIKNFGTFSLKEKKKRIGRNPKTKDIHEISERNVVTFKQADNLKKKLNTYARKYK
jgi:integration host factor subunit alpha